MITQIAWNVFKNTGNIDTFLEFREVQRQVQNIENSIKVNEYENCKNKRNNNC